MTARLLDGIVEADLVVAVRVLDEVRARAQEERGRLAEPASAGRLERSTDAVLHAAPQPGEGQSAGRPLAP